MFRPQNLGETLDWPDMVVMGQQPRALPPSIMSTARCFTHSNGGRYFGNRLLLKQWHRSKTTNGQNYSGALRKIKPAKRVSKQENGQKQCINYPNVFY